MARYIGKGAEIAVKTATSPLTYTKVAQVMNIGAITFTSDEVETTIIDDDYRQFLQSVKDGGTLQLDVVLDPSDTTHVGTSNALFELYGSGTVKDWRISIPSSPVFGLTFQGYVSEFTLGELNNAAAVTANVSIRVQGQPALAAI